MNLIGVWYQVYQFLAAKIDVLLLDTASVHLFVHLLLLHDRVGPGAAAQTKTAWKTRHSPPLFVSQVLK